MIKSQQNKKNRHPGLKPTLENQKPNSICGMCIYWIDRRCSGEIGNVSYIPSRNIFFSVSVALRLKRPDSSSRE
jgi:hypothetical protein